MNRYLIPACLLCGAILGFAWRGGGVGSARDEDQQGGIAMVTAADANPAPEANFNRDLGVLAAAAENRADPAAIREIKIPAFRDLAALAAGVETYLRAADHESELWVSAALLAEVAALDRIGDFDAGDWGEAWRAGALRDLAEVDPPLARKLAAGKGWSIEGEASLGWWRRDWAAAWAFQHGYYQANREALEESRRMDTNDSAPFVEGWLVRARDDDAAQWAAAIASGQIDPKYAGVSADWALVDPAGAARSPYATEADIGSLPDIPSRIAFARELAAVSHRPTHEILAKGDFTAALAWIAEVAHEGARVEMMNQILDANAEIKPAHFREYPELWKLANREQFFSGKVLRAAFYADPERLIAQIDQHPESVEEFESDVLPPEVLAKPEWLGRLMRAGNWRVSAEIAQQWARRDPQAALAAALAVPEENTSSHKAAVAAAVGGWAEVDPAAATRFAGTLPPESLVRMDAAGAIAEGLATSDPELAFAWLKESFARFPVAPVVPGNETLQRIQQGATAHGQPYLARQAWELRGRKGPEPAGAQDGGTAAMLESLKDQLRFHKPFDDPFGF
ncbi:MAG: hypothetical protein R3F11_01895 [Verrucomicrobiales bacterium]